MKIKSLCYLLSILITLFIAGTEFAQETDIPDQGDQDTSVIVPESTEDQTDVQSPEDAATAPDAEEQDQTATDENQPSTKKTKKSTAKTQAMSKTTSAGEGGETIEQGVQTQSQPVPDAYVYTGAAGYSVPITVPPGRNGLTPKISLTYNSYRANSWVGVGWNLDLGSIRRSTKRGLSYAADDYVYESTGSSEELVSASAAWGTNYYRAKIEENFTKYYLSNNSWTVTAKDGTKYYYGSNQYSRQSRDNQDIDIFQWCLDKIEDTNGNYILITYINNQGQLYPSEIKYTYHTNPALDPAHSIKFILEDRTDVNLSYATNAKVVTAKRLKAIEVYSSNTQLVRKYVIEHNYSPNTSRSLINSITQYGSDGATPLPAIGFQYQDGGTVGTFTDPILHNGGSLLPGMADVNGDGLTDLVSYGATNNETQSDNFSCSYRLSLGDGQFGPLVSKAINLGSIFYYKAETREECHETENHGIVCHDVPTGNVDPAYALRTFIGDLNGDGKLDVVISGYVDYNSARVAVCLGIGNGDFNAPIIINGIDCPTEIADVNGDGLGDWISHSATNNETQSDKFSCSYRLSLGNGQFGPLVNKTINLGSIFYYKAETKEVCGENENWGIVCHDVPTGNVDPAYALHTFMGDLNGDGKLDVIISGYVDYNSARVAICLGKGDGDFEAPILINGIGSPSEIVDVNGDGLGDWVAYGTANKMRPYANDQLSFLYRLSLGNGQFAPLVSQTIKLSDNTSPYPTTPNPFYGECVPKTSTCESNQNPAYNLQTRVGDINGDGKLDIVIGGYVDYNSPRAFTLLSTGPAPDLLASVSNGYGGSAAIGYIPSSQYTNTDLPFVMQTVSSVTVNDGLGNQATSAYTYQGGFYDFPEREFRGFASAKKTNPDATIEETWFLQDKYFQGRAYQTEFRDPSATLLSKSTLTWETEEISSGVTFVKLGSRRSESYDAETVFSQENYTYDNTNGNLLTTMSSGTGAENVINESQYQNYGDWTWRKTIETLKNGQGTILRKITDDWQQVTGNLLSKTSWLNGGDNPQVFMTYDEYGNLKTLTDARGNSTSTGYDPQTNTYPIKVMAPPTNGVTHITETGWNYLYSRPAWTKDENQNSASYTYDLFGRLIQIDYPDGGQKLYQYYDNEFPCKLITKVKEDLAGHFIDKYEYFDGFGRSIQVSTLGNTLGDDNVPKSVSIISQTFYDNMGRVNLTNGPFFGSGMGYPQTAPSAGYPLIWTSYDFRGRPVTIKSKHGDYPGIDEYITISFAYSGFKSTITDPDGDSKTERKDYLGRIKEVVEYNAIEEYHTFYQYNAAGDLLKVIDALNHETTLVYDTLGRKREMTDPDMGHWTYDYDKNGNLISQIDAKAQEIRFEYDPLNRVLNKKYFINGLPSSIDGQVLYTYDNLTPDANGRGRLYTVTKANIILSNNKYDKMGRSLKVTKTIDSTPYVTQNEYDLSGKGTKLIYPDNTEVKNEFYPGTNLLQNVITNNVITALYTDYEPTGKIGQINYQNGTATRYNYDAWSTKLFGIVTTGPGGDLQDREYTYSRAGDILQIQDNAKGITYHYAYDNLHRLIGEQLDGPNAPQATTLEVITLDYTGAGPVHGVKTIDLNGVSRTCAYDLNGNMVTSPDFSTPANLLNRTITYDMDNMPTRIVHANGTTVDFTYDGVGKRTKKLVAGGKTVLYLGEHYEMENGISIKYIFGGNLRLAQIKGSLTSYFHKDHLNSTAVVTNEAGAKIESTTYEPFGSTRIQEGTSISSYKFTDQELDNETGLYNYNARLYDPVLGMFVTPDSIMQAPFDPQIFNRFSYCRNNPLIYSDPSGHEVIIEIQRGAPTGISTPGTFSARSTVTGASIAGTTLELDPDLGTLAQAGEWEAFVRDIGSNGTDYNPDRIQTDVNRNNDGLPMDAHQDHIGNTIRDITGCIEMGSGRLGVGSLSLGPNRGKSRDPKDGEPDVINGINQNSVANSIKTMEKIIELIRKEDIIVGKQIRNDPDLNTGGRVINPPSKYKNVRIIERIINSPEIDQRNAERSNRTIEIRSRAGSGGFI